MIFNKLSRSRISPFALWDCFEKKQFFFFFLALALQLELRRDNLTVKPMINNWFIQEFRNSEKLKTGQKVRNRTPDLFSQVTYRLFFHSLSLVIAIHCLKLVSPRSTFVSFWKQLFFSRVRFNLKCDVTIWQWNIWQTINLRKNLGALRNWCDLVESCFVSATIPFQSRFYSIVTSYTRIRCQIMQHSLKTALNSFEKLDFADQMSVALISSFWYRF
jgi:hypothetical protein